jgi:hypothetical protein
MNWLNGEIRKVAGVENTNGNDPFKLFPFRRLRIAPLVASGYGYYGWLHFHLLRTCALCRFIFQPIAFGFCLLQHRLQAVPSAFLAVGLPGRSVLQTQCGTFLAISASAAWNIFGFSAFLFPGIIEETCVPFSPGPQLNLIMNDWRFFRLTERVRSLFSSNL